MIGYESEINCVRIVTSLMTVQLQGHEQSLMVDMQCRAQC